MSMPNTDAAATGTVVQDTSRQFGVIKWYNAKKGFGFISPDLDDIPFTINLVGQGHRSVTSDASGGSAGDAAVRRPAAPADVFMHKSALQPGISTKDNARVEFELGLDKRGRKVAVRCANAQPLCPSRLAHCLILTLSVGYAPPPASPQRLAKRSAPCTTSPPVGCC